ncbi:MAG: type II toxin-antitoxin system RelE/ParE family toxin [Desulfovibrio sp.]|uniref:type II toxin-antitoxin system RelE family toxin n=1 Tax=Desulfovibrio sp. TaxID=885 RepID=UPI001A763132|nr:type II toxin-antitoxin system RelE/ParE family toxin [Desulfovibrio sp.]MBD5416820.1 type II toxin-antitoxin system RelE/ParE family toxin [Desulfovibrio sp.]
MWEIEYSEKAARELMRIDREAARRIKRYLDERIATAADPRRFGEGLSENLSGLWKYRIGDYRVIAEIQDERFIVLVIRVGHRSKVYGAH